MKMTREDFQTLNAAVSPHMQGSSERERWDALWASGFDTRPLYHKGLHDDHIDTALRRIQSTKGSN